MKRKPYDGARCKSRRDALNFAKADSEIMVVSRSSGDFIPQHCVRCCLTVWTVKMSLAIVVA